MVQKAKSGKIHIKIIKIKTREGTVRTLDSLTKLDKRRNTDKISNQQGIAHQGEYSTHQLSVF